MSKFKIGEKVRYLRDDKDTRSFHKGGEYIVGGKYHTNGPTCGVLADDEGKENGHKDYYFELVTQETGPVRTRTVTEIVDGYYGVLKIVKYSDTTVHVLVGSVCNADELTEAIKNLTAIRDALEGGAS